MLTSYKQIADYQRASQLKGRHIMEVLPLEVVKKLVKTHSQLPSRDELSSKKKLVYESLKKKYAQTQQAGKLKKLLYKEISSHVELKSRPAIYKKTSTYLHSLTNKKLVQYGRLQRYLDNVAVSLRYRTAGIARFLTHALLKRARNHIPVTTLSLKYGQGGVRF